MMSNMQIIIIATSGVASIALVGCGKHDQCGLTGEICTNAQVCMEMVSGQEDSKICVTECNETSDCASDEQCLGGICVKTVVEVQDTSMHEADVEVEDPSTHEEDANLPEVGEDGHTDNAEIDGEHTTIPEENTSLPEVDNDDNTPQDVQETEADDSTPQPEDSIPHEHEISSPKEAHVVPSAS